MKCRLFVVFGLLGLFSLPAFALTVNDLYQTSVPVADESAQVRVDATQRAMQQVLVKLSGNSDIAIVTGAEQIINRAQQFVQQFRYRQTAAKSGEQDETELQVKFDEDALTNEIRNYGLPLWGKERPVVLIWMAQENAAGRSIISLEENTGIIDLVDSAAADRGIPLIFPLMDLEDNSKMNISDLWGDFQQPIETASERYPSDAIAVGRIMRGVNSGWLSRWTLYINQQAIRWSAENQQLSLMLDAAVNQLADALAERYANSGSSGAELLEVAVSNVETHDDYARALKYLQSLQSVTEVMVKTVMPELVTFEIVSHGGQDTLDQAIRLGRVLQPSDTGQLLYILQDVSR